jgi:methyl-accepting chemotaxis protein
MPKSSKTSINRKVTSVILLTCAAVLLLAGAATIATELLTSSRAMIDTMRVQADLLGRNTTAPLSFHREEDLEEVTRTLSALQADSHIIGARVYDQSGTPFGDYVRDGATEALPTVPPPEGHHFTRNYLELSHPIEANDKRIGTIVLRSDLGRMYNQVFLHAGIVGGVLLVAILLATAVSPRLRRPISDPILALAHVARQIAEKKDYSVRASITTGYKEIGLLTDAFNQMLGEIESRQSSLQRVNLSLKEQTRDIVESINVLVTSASEILATSTSLATSAAQTAMAVNQTTVTVDEVRQTALISSQKAKQVSESAKRVVETSRAGQKSTEETIEGMQRIRRQVDSIADSMVRLSEQSQIIGQIIATVDDLAAQSNLLAVNASIEAARAGEHGKGFAIVALEVRSLAEQSKQATRQVRNILNEIQGATTGAVMATEQGSKAVESGVRQSAQAGQSIQTLAGSVIEAANVATQIATSSQQQLVGVDQVASAMESIKQASDQNVASAKQLESAAYNLKELGQKLKQTTDRSGM